MKTLLFSFLGLTAFAAAEPEKAPKQAAVPAEEVAPPKKTAPAKETSEKQPLVIETSDKWTVKYESTEEATSYTLTHKEEKDDDGAFLISKWPAPGTKDDIPQYVDMMGKEFLSEIKKSEEVKLETEKYTVEDLKGDSFSGKFVLFKLATNEGKLIQTMFIITDGKDLWNGQFTGSEERWKEAQEILKKIKRS